MSEVFLLRHVPEEDHNPNRRYILMAQIGGHTLDLSEAMSSLKDQEIVKVETRETPGKFYPYNFVYRAKQAIFVAEGHYYQEPKLIGHGAIIHPGATFEQDVIIERSTEIGKDSVVRAGTILGQMCITGAYSRQGPGARVGSYVVLDERSELRGKVWVGAYSYVGKRAIINGGSTLGEDCFIEDDISLMSMRVNLASGSRVDNDNKIDAMEITE